MGSFPYLNDKPMFAVGDKVVAKRDTRSGIMSAEPMHIGKVGVVTSATHLRGQKQPFYGLDFDGRIDYADHCTLSGLDVV